MSNDTSTDVREQFRDLIADGATAQDATDQVLTAFAEDVDDDDAGPDVWLGLAQVQVQTGRLQDRVRDEALRLIDDGTDLRRWTDLGAEPATLRKREAALAKLRAQLTGPQKTPTKVRVPKRFVTEFSSGDVLAFRYGERTALLLVTSRFKTGDGTFPVVLIAPDVERTDLTQDELMHVPMLSVDYEKNEAWARERTRGSALSYGPIVREVARVRPGEDVVYVAGETTAPESLCLVALTELSFKPEDARTRTEQVTRVGRWEVPDEVIGVLRLFAWGQLEAYLQDSIERGWG